MAREPMPRPLAVEVFLEYEASLHRLVSRLYSMSLDPDDIDDAVAHCRVVAARLDNGELPTGDDLVSAMAGANPGYRTSLIRAYLCQSAKNEAGRLAKQPRTSQLPDGDADLSDPPDSFTDGVAIKEIRRYLLNLDQRDVTVMVERAQGSTWGQVAAKAKCSEKTARRVYDRHIKVLQDTVLSDDDEAST